MSVNGHPIPFNMKIGEAGEAFFIFETEGDVPDELITSPLLQPTRPEEASGTNEDVHSDRFGAKKDKDKEVADDFDRSAMEATQEPDFLDLDASSPADTTSPPPPKGPSELSQPHALPSPPPSPSVTPSSILTLAEAKGTTLARTVEETAKNLFGQANTPNVISKPGKSKVHSRNEVYTYPIPSDIELDAVGYHSQSREPSDHTIKDEFRSRTPSLPSISRPHTPPTPNHEPLDTNIDTVSFPTTPTSPSRPSYTLSRKDKPSLKSPVPIPFPTPRSTSEPPMDTELNGQPLLQISDDPIVNGLGLSMAPPVQEYSWEWGAFPQPSPMKNSFKDPRWDTLGKAKTKGKTRLPMVLVSDSDAGEDGDVEEINLDREMLRSRSVPPGLEGSPRMKRKELKGGGEFGYGDVDVDAEVDGVLDRMKGTLRADEDEDDGVSGGISERGVHGMGFGAGGRLIASSRDPTRIGAFIEGKTAQFELSLVEDGGRDGGIPKIFDGHDELEAARVFEEGKIDYHKFLDDESVAKDERLVIRWAGDQ